MKQHMVVARVDIVTADGTFFKRGSKVKVDEIRKYGIGKSLLTDDEEKVLKEVNEKTLAASGHQSQAVSVLTEKIAELSAEVAELKKGKQNG